MVGLDKYDIRMLTNHCSETGTNHTLDDLENISNTSVDKSITDEQKGLDKVNINKVHYKYRVQILKHKAVKKQKKTATLNAVE